MNVERFVPVDPPHDRCYDYFFRTSTADAANKESGPSLGCDDPRRRQGDLRSGAGNLEPGVYDIGRLSPRHETGVAAFHQWVTESLRPLRSTEPRMTTYPMTSS